MIEILLVEDDPVLGRGLTVNLELEGYKVHWASTLKSAAATEQKLKPQLILLDVNLPDGNGLHFLRDLRAAGSRIPVIVLTAKTDEESVVQGLQLGASDYVRKPFGDRELFARIKTALRETTVRSEEVRYGDVLVLLDQRKASIDGVKLNLSPREFDIFSYFVQNAEAVITRELLLRTFAKGEELTDRTIDSNISHLRTKLREAQVKTIQISSIYGVGYRLERK